MPSKNKAGNNCGCCTGTCCVANKDLFVDVTFGSLTPIDNVKINAGNGGDCLGMSDGFHGDPEIHVGDNGWEGPTVQVAGPPAIRGAVYPTGSWQWHRYEDGFSFITNEEPNAGCYAYFGTDLIIKETGISGTVELVKGNEPNVYPYAVRLHHWIYVDDEGDCILRVGAEFCGRRDAVSFELENGRIEFLFNSRLPYPNFGFPKARTSSVVHKYSDYNPCYEDGPIEIIGGGVGAFRNGGTTTLEPFDASSTNEPPWDPSDPRLQTADDVLPLSPWNQIGLFPWLPIWVWEINLTDSSITDLADLPTVTLDSSNLTGVIAPGSTIAGSGSITADLDPVPADLSPYVFQYHVSGSTAITSAQVADSPEQIIRNQPGQHICRIDAREGTECSYFYDWVQWRHLQADHIRWFFEYAYANSTTDIPITAISLTLKPSAS